MRRQREDQATKIGQALAGILGRLTTVESSVAALEWSELVQAAAANTYFTVEDLGTVATGAVWVVEATVGAGKVPAAAPTTRQGDTVQLRGIVTRATTGAAPAVSFTLSGAGGTLGGWSSGVRLAVVSNNIELQGRVTTADTLTVRWRRSVSVIAL
jgi:hypothetical protein